MTPSPARPRAHLPRRHRGPRPVCARRHGRLAGANGPLQVERALRVPRGHRRSGEGRLGATHPRGRLAAPPRARAAHPRGRLAAPPGARAAHPRRRLAAPPGARAAHPRRRLAAPPGAPAAQPRGRLAARPGAPAAHPRGRLAAPRRARAAHRRLRGAAPAAADLGASAPGEHVLVPAAPAARAGGGAAQASTPSEPVCDRRRPSVGPHVRALAKRVVLSSGKPAAHAQ